MFSKKLMSRKMFQEGGMVTPSMPAPSGGIVEGLGLNAPAMPPIPPQDQAALTEGLADMASKIGQVDAAEDTASLINAIRSDNQSLDDRYTELARYVGRDDATKTPESVLTLVQPTFEMLEQGGGLGMLGSDILQGDAPMGDMMTTTMTETTEAPTLFNQGGFAVKKPQTPVKRQTGSPMTGEVASPFRFDLYSAQMDQGPYLQTRDEPLTTTERLNLTQAEIDQQRRQMSPIAQFTGSGLPEQQTYLRGVLAANPYTEASVRETITTGLREPQTAQQIFDERNELIQSQDLLLEEDPQAAKRRLDALLAPTMTEAKSPEELLQERQEFMGETDRSPEALFALAQAFNTLANTPGTLLQGVAAGSGQAAQLLAPIVREQELLDQQMRSAAFDRSIDLAERLQGEKRDIAISALTQAQNNVNANKAFAQSTVASAIEEAAIQARNAQEREVLIRQEAMRLGLDWSEAQIQSVSDLYEDFKETRVDEVGREYATIFDPGTNTTREQFIGFRGEGNEFYEALPFRVKATDPTFIMPTGAVVDANGRVDLSRTRPVQDVGNLSAPDLARIKQRMIERQNSMFGLSQILADAVPESATGPAEALKSFATHAIGTFGVDLATFLEVPRNRARVAEWARTYIAANALSDRYAMGEQEILNSISDADPAIFKNPQALAERLQTIMTGMINDNEFDQALIERRAPARLEYLASGTKSDPLDYSKDSVRRLLSVASEQGREGSWNAKLTPQDATVVDFGRIKEDGTLETYEEIMAAFEAGQRAGADKYRNFVENNNPVFAEIILKRSEDGTSEPTLQTFGFTQAVQDRPVGRGVGSDRFTT